MLWRSMEKMGCKRLILWTWDVKRVFRGRMVVVSTLDMVGNVVFSRLKVPPRPAKNQRRRIIIVETVSFWLIPVD